MNSIDELILKSNIKKSDINVIYLDTGPGFYTSLRIGLAVSQGICATLGIPLVSVNGLDALAFAAHTGHRKICSIIDSKRDEFAFCTYKPVPGGVVRESEPEVLNENTLKQKLNEDNEKKLIVGDWKELNEKTMGDSSYLKFGSPENNITWPLPTLSLDKYAELAILCEASGQTKPLILTLRSNPAGILDQFTTLGTSISLLGIIFPILTGASELLLVIRIG